MTPPRLYSPTVRTGSVSLDAAEERHATASLRLRDGDPIVLFNGLGGLGYGRLANRGEGKRAAWTAEIERVEQVPEPSGGLTLFVAAPKGERLDWLVEKCTELNAAALIFVHCERAVRRLDMSHELKLRRITIEAAKQCGRPWLPRLEARATATAAVAAWQSAGRSATRLVLAEPRAERALPAWVRENSAVRLGVLIGPEGGWSDVEREALAARGAEALRLCDTILRIETAAVAVAALCEGLRDA